MWSRLDHYWSNVHQRDHRSGCLLKRFIVTKNTTELHEYAITVKPRFNEPRHNEDPVITNNIWKPGRISVKYMETNPAITNPAITKSPL